MLDKVENLLKCILQVIFIVACFIVLFFPVAGTLLLSVYFYDEYSEIFDRLPILSTLTLGILSLFHVMLTGYLLKLTGLL